jgi:nucleotide-binding universal stress UspA family protein
MKRIVIATDGSDGARQALEQGFALASDAGADVSVVYVRRSPNSFMGAPYYQDVITEEARHAKSVMDDARVRATRFDVETEYDVLEGDPVEEVLALARLRHADLIVVGSRGVGILSRVVLGSFSKAIVHRADRPVLVARTPAAVAAA